MAEQHKFVAKKHKSVAPPTMASNNIPEDVVVSEILPRLPFKSLCRFKCVSKKWNSLRFLPKSGMVYASPNGIGIVFLPTSETSVRVQNPSSAILFSSKDYYHIQNVVASTNGLLCLQCSRLQGDHGAKEEGCFLYVCNPAGTGKGQVIPDSQGRNNVGMEFNPLSSPKEFRLVQPIQCHMRDLDIHCYASYERTYAFELFSSETRKWSKSGAKATIRTIWDEELSERSVCANGVIYWDCHLQLISFNPKEDSASVIPLPKVRVNYCDIEQEIGEWEGQVTCTRVFRLWGVQVWTLRNGGWELMHRVSFDSLVERNRDFFSYLWKATGIAGNVVRLEYCCLHPFPFGGGKKLYIRTRVEESGEELTMVMSYDMTTGEVVKFRMDKIGRRRRPYYQLHHNYHHNMAASLICLL